ncbi:MAG: biotin--[acetyl-CoA-carboxylase] ligase [Alphaproteobacteria bacterium]|nr:biotin--[acetyl-CoA-carboxylase] ligase [Alphaproteobacteria bacterium]
MTGVADAPDGFTIVEHESLPSTNDEATRMAQDGAAAGTVVWAHRQTAGRGRRGRAWDSPTGNLFCSVLLRPGVPPAVAAQLSLVAAVAVADIAAAVLNADAVVEQKWPNDVLVDGAKIAGILLESSGATGSRVDWIVIGMGLNVQSSPVDTETSSTSLREQGAADVSVTGVLGRLLTCLQARYAQWETAGVAPIRAAWLDRARGVGQPITVRLPEAVMEGRFADMDETGALILEMPDGQRRRVTAGDVFFSA